LSELGLKPDLEKSRLSSAARELVKPLSDSAWLAILNLDFNPAQLTELQQFLHGFLIYHLGKIPASRAAALIVGPNSRH